MPWASSSAKHLESLNIKFRVTPECEAVERRDGHKHAAGQPGWRYQASGGTSESAARSRWKLTSLRDRMRGAPGIYRFVVQLCED